MRKTRTLAPNIKNWIRTLYTLEFLGTWEQVNNHNFKVVEFDHFKTQAGLPSFVLSVSEWIEKTNAVGIIVKKGKYGGTYAHKDIAYRKCCWEFPPNNTFYLNPSFLLSPWIS